MKIVQYRQRQNCIPLNVLFSGVCITLTSQGLAPLYRASNKIGRGQNFEKNASLSRNGKKLLLMND